MLLPALAATAAAAALLHGHVKPVCRVDGGARCHVDLLPWHQLEVEALEDDCQGHNRLHEGKLVAHTLAGAAAEGDIPAVAGRTRSRRVICMIGNVAEAWGARSPQAS